MSKDPKTPSPKWLLSPYIIYGCLLTPFVLCFPALFLGLVGDDYYHKAILLNSLPYDSNPFTDLFTFFHGSIEKNQFLIDIGVLPWWAELNVQASFMRPISVLTHVFDYMLWPDILFLHHIHSMLWMSAGIWATYRVFLVLLPKESWLIHLSILLFAVEDAHIVATSWLANRNACVAFFFAMLCFRYHILWCQKDQKTSASASYKSQFFFVLALLSGESGICILGYILAYNFMFTTFAKGKRYIPYIFWIVLWRILYTSLGFGTFGSSIYIDPIQSPLLFIERFFFRGPLLFTSLYTQFPSDMVLFLPTPTQNILQGLCIVFAIGMFFWIHKQRNSLISFFFIGSVFSIIPLCGAFPMDRLLLFPSFGFAAIVALLVQQKYTRWIQGLLFLHLPLALILNFTKGFQFFILKDLFSMGLQAIPENIQSHQSIFYIHGMELPCAFTTIISFNENIEFKGIALLSSSSKKATVTTQSDTDFTLSYDQGMFSGTFDRMTLNRDHLFKLNTTIERHNYSVTIVDTIDGEPSHIKIHVPKGIHHPDFIWQYQKGFKFFPFDFPPIGESKIIYPFYESGSLWE